jgi:hypothetical protein
MPHQKSFIEPGDGAEIGDDVAFHGDRGNPARELFD